MMPFVDIPRTQCSLLPHIYTRHHYGTIQDRLPLLRLLCRLKSSVLNHFESHSILAMYEPRKVACSSKYVTIVCNNYVEHI